MRRLKLWSVTLALILPLGLSAQYSKLVFSGQAFGSGAYGSDPHPDYESYEGGAGYIPAFSVRAGGSAGGIGLEVLVSYRLGYLMRQHDIQDGAKFYGFSSIYRSWLQVRAATWEVRLGKQKLAFGPGRILRPLAWFDTIDLRDPTGQTGGVDAIRGRFFPTDQLTIWTWGLLPITYIVDKFEEFSPGGRAEYIAGNFEFGLTAHRRNSKSLAGLPGSTIFLLGPETRVAFDVRADLAVGLWTEVLLSRGADQVDEYDGVQMMMMGIDYTLPVGDGVMVMAEHQFARANGVGDIADATSRVTAFMASMRLGFLDNLMAVAYIDHESDFAALFLMWQRTYDSFSLSTIFSANPGRSDLGDLADNFTSVVGVGTSVQLVLNFYH